MTFRFFGLPQESVQLNSRQHPRDVKSSLETEDYLKGLWGI
jgi:hypothetical protein